MKKWLGAIALLLSIVGLAGCGNEASDRLVLTGSSTVAPLIMEIGRRFEEANPGTRVNVQTGGSSRGINDTRNGLADIGMVSRDLKDSEADLVPSTIAWDGITSIIHKENRVKALSREQIIAIYTGKIDNWQQLGGDDADIVVVHKAEGRSTLELFLNHFALDNRQVKADIIVGDNQHGLKTVAGNPLAIGYVSIGAAAYESEQGEPIKLLAIDGVNASLNNLKKGLFPIARPLNLVTSKQPTELAQRFLTFSQSVGVADLVQKQFFIPAYANE